jgi:hypothetical protein
MKAYVQEVTLSRINTLGDPKGEWNIKATVTDGTHQWPVDFFAMNNGGAADAIAALEERILDIARHAVAGFADSFE